ncbi:uncharacterized protein BP5553_02073 [Venustampulla echinocandica]|uniref:PhoD-like phosphatase domain-containing protein n=1 Tax=Venustampulla echinocandica TaxID=2656787 RepID=A0A370U2T1_9HELO|nr:uncharacterized protein BP5553_02073 [Venustampulla echinocandica]RDL42094.1 hypothetical protein BP5553_02073 [Venustampulla echinocandica]
MASHYTDNIIHGGDHEATHASQSKWRHEESSAFRRHAATAPRHADERSDSNDLAHFLNATRIDPHESGGPPASTGKHKPLPVPGNATSAGHYAVGPGHPTTGDVANALEVKCGPLLNYRRMENETWFGSVLVVTNGGGLAESPVAPELTVRIVQQVDNRTTRANEGLPVIAFQSLDQDLYADPSMDTGERPSWEAKVTGVRLYSDPANTFWRFSLEVPMQQSEIQCEYTISNLHFSEGKKTDKQNFFIPAISESMRIMFHSCNGFSVGTDEAAWSGPALWNDVARAHKKTPFHVMLGGGDQIYNDGIRVHGPLKEWTAISNPKKRKDYPFPEALRKACDEYYANNYIQW